MKLNDRAVVFIPDGEAEDKALARTTHLAVSAHQDDIELMAASPAVECFGLSDKWFSGVVVTNGAGSPRSGIYGEYTDEQMQKIRITEQKKAAYVGEYGAQLLLGFSSSEVKDVKNDEVVDELYQILSATKPDYVYTHNFADKHDTHVATAIRLVFAIRKMPVSERPKKLYGCEVWRGLDWVNDDKKIYLDTTAHPNISRSMLGVFDSQICGGKRYDLAAEGRRTANATYAASHGCDELSAMNYAIDMTELIISDELDVAEYIFAYIDDFKKEVADRLNKLK